jgi:hypothetical protein
MSVVPIIPSLAYRERQGYLRPTDSSRMVSSSKRHRRRLPPQDNLPSDR